MRMAISYGGDLPEDPEFPLMLGEALILAAEHFPAAGVHIDQSGFLSYPDLLAEASRIAGGLRGKTGQYAILRVGDSEYFPAFWGCVLAGLIPVTAGATGVIGHVWEKLGKPSIIGGTQEAPALREMSFAASVISTGELAAGPVTEPSLTAQPDEVAMLQLSSGSTGQPKIIQITHRGVSEYAIGARSLLDIGPGDVLLNWLPLDHVAGLMLYHLGGAFLGATTVQAATDPVLADPLRWLDLMQSYRATHGWAPNFAFRLVTDALSHDPGRAWDLRHVKRLVSGGEQCSPAAFQSFADATAAYGLNAGALTTGWGMSETCTGITFASFGESWCRQGEFLSVGPPAPGATLRIVDNEWNVLPETETGRLQVRSARVTPGYISDPEADATAFPVPGWLDTGDLAYMRDGRITITGREKDMVIINGHNYSSHEIEQVVQDIDGIAERMAAACGVPDERTGTEQLVIFYVPTGLVGHDDVAARITTAIGRRLRLPVARIVAVPEFPRTSGGKIQRRALRDSLAQRRQPVRQLVIEAVSSLIPGAAVDPAKPFYELGLGSVQIVQLQARLAEALGVQVPSAAMFAHPTVDALAAHLGNSPAPAAGPSDQKPAHDGRIAIIGMAARFPGAKNVDEYWANLMAGVDSVTHFTRADRASAGLPVDDPGFVAASGVLEDVTGFDAAFFGITAKEAELLDPQHRQFLETCYHALEHAGYAGAVSEQVSLFAGSGMNLYPHHTYLHRNLSQTTASGDVPASIGAALGNQPDFLATRVAYRLGFTGPAINVQTACSTSLVAVHMAVQSLLTGDSSLAIAGAAAIHVPQVTGYRYSPDSILSPDGKCRPFDAGAAGTVGGNGIAAVVLKRLDRAMADGDTIHAVLLGSAVNNDGAARAGFTAPGVSGQLAVIRAALNKARVAPESVGYVEAHGTGTALGDPIEFEALLAGYPQGGYLGSVKANIGHLDSCAGMAGLIKTVLMVREGLIPPQLNFTEPHPALGFERGRFRIATSLTPWHGLRRAAVTALGAGGTNAHVLVEQAPVPQAGSGEAPALLPLSAADPVALRQLADSYQSLSQDRHADVVYTAAVGRSHRRHRLVAFGSTLPELTAGLAKPMTGVVPATGAAEVAFAFPGQGTDLRPIVALAARFPEVREAWSKVDPELARRVAAGDQGTEVAQPALAALGIGLGEMWRGWGLTPAYVVGHSVGEYAALALAGSLDAGDAIGLATLRGRLMASLMPPGAMAAVFGDASIVEDLLTRVPALELAAVNASGQYVVSGPPAAIADALALGLPMRQLDVSRAFHSSATSAVLPALRAAIAAVTFRPVTVPFVSTLDGLVRQPGWIPDADYLCRQAREPVQFARAVSALQDGVLVVEAGPDAVLSTLAGEGWIASQPTGLEPVAGVWRAVGSLYCAGASLDWHALLAGSDGRRIPLPGYPFQHRRFWVSNADSQLARVRSLTANCLAVVAAEVPPDEPFLAMGADSLLLASLSAEIQREFGTRVPVRDLFGDLSTPRKVATHLATQPASTPATSHSFASPPPTLSPPPSTSPLALPPSAVVPAPATLSRSTAAAAPAGLPPSAVVPAATLFRSSAAPASAVLSSSATGAGFNAVAFGSAASASTVPIVGGATGAAAGAGVDVDAAAQPRGDLGPPPVALRAAESDSIAGIIQRQLEVMSQQLDLLRSTDSTMRPAAIPGSATSAAAAALSPMQASTVPASAAPPRVGPASAALATASAAPEAAPRVVAGSAVAGSALVPAVVGSGGGVVAGPEAGGFAGNLSLYFFGDYPAVASQDKYELILDAAEFADRNGLHGVWVPERHFHSFGGLFPNPSVLAAAIAARTKRIRINAGSVVLPLHNPIRVAEEWSMVDNLSGGRAGIGCAPGWHANDFVFFPDNFGRSKQVMYEHLETVQKLWRGEAIEARSGDGKPIEVTLHPKPVQAMPPLFTAIVGNPDSYREAARRGIGVVTNLMTQDVAQLAANIALYRREWAEHGHDPDQGRVVVLLHTHLGDDLETVRDSAFEPFCAYLRSSFSLLGQVTNSLGMNIDLDNTPEDDVRFILGRAYERYCQERALIGTPQSCQSVLESVMAAGADEIACFIDFGLPGEAVLAGLPFLAKLTVRPGQAVRPGPIAARGGTWAQTGDEPRNEVRVVPLSSGQRRLWLAEQVHPGGTAYNEAAATRLDGPLEVEALRGALGDVVARHGPLRTSYHDGQQNISSHVTVGCPVVDCAGQDEAEAVRHALSAVSTQVFDLDNGPVFSFRLLRLSPVRHVLITAFHHLAADGRSYAVFTRDLSEFYRARVSGVAAVLPALLIGYPQVVWPGRDEQDLSYWRQRLADAPANLTLPSDLRRPAQPTAAGRSVFFDLPAKSLRQFSREHRVTPFTTLISAFAATLARVSGQDDLIVGTGVTSRTQQTNDLIGFFVDTLPLRFSLAGDPAFAEFTARVQADAADAYAHTSVPFDELAGELAGRREPGRHPFFDIAIEYESGGAFDFEFPGIVATPLNAGLDKAPVDLMVYLSYRDSVRCHVEFRTEVLDETTVRRLFADFEQLLEQAIAAPDVPLSGLPLSGSVLRGRQTEPAGESLHELFLRQASISPGATAVVDGEEAWSYAELRERAQQIAKDLDLEPGDLAAVVLPRGGELIAAQLGIMMSGGAFLPIDPSTPDARIAEVLHDSGACLVLTADGVSRREGRGAHPAMAWCIYTSGSAGRPKGVLVPQSAAVNAIQWHVRALELSPHDRVAHGLNAGFDANLAEIYPALVSGATVCVVPEVVRADAAALVRWWRSASVSVAFLPVPVAELVFEHEVPLRTLVVGGSQLRRRPPAGFAAAVINAYGPTENAIVATAGPVASGVAGIIDIGVPVDNVTARIADASGRTVPLGAVGELCLKGGSLGSYLDGPFPGGEYRTGDLARVRGDGTLEYAGRIDDQVKISGYRVEPGEVSAVLSRVPGVAQAAVIARHDRGQEPYLAAYVVGTDPRPAVAALLPPYLMPATWTFLPSLPLTSSGKVDTTALPTPAWPSGGGTPSTNQERHVHTLWCTELGRPAVPLDMSFFQAGGNSLGAMRVANQLDIPVHQVLEAQGISALAADLSVISSGPASHQQEVMWRRQQAKPDPAAVHLALRITLTGRLDLPALTQGFDELVRRHAALRSRLSEHDGVLLQEVLAHEPFTIPLEDVRTEDLEAWCVRQGRQPFTGSPMLRVSAAILGSEHTVLLLAVHHLAADGWSMMRLLGELPAAYIAALHGQPSSSPPASTLSYVDYARRQRETPAAPDVLRYWRGQLSGAPRNLRIAGGQPVGLAGAEHAFTVPAETAAGLSRLASQFGTSLFPVLASGYATLLHRITGNAEIVLACPYAHRDDRDLEPLVGFFSSAIMLRLRPLDDVGAYLGASTAAFCEAVRHQPMYLPVLMRELDATWEPGKPAPFGDAMFAWNPGLPELDLPGLTTSLLDQPLGCARRELATVLTPHGDQLMGSIEYNTSLFDEAAVAAFASEFVSILTAFVQWRP